MKKVILSAALVAISGLTFAQDMMSKKGTPILPEANDWSIGFDAVPVIDWAFDKTRIMSNSGVTSSGNAISYQGRPNTIVGKMMKDATTAYRAKLRLGFGSTSNDTLVSDLSSTNPDATVTDNTSTSNMNITLGAGLQKYRGKGRLQGFYGAEALISLGSNSTSKTYGNALSATNPGSRTTEDSQGSTFEFGVRGFIGAEYFFAPKMSIGVEYGLGLGLSSIGEGETTTEYYDGVAGAVKTSTSKTGGSSTFGLDVDNNAAGIYLSLYF